MNKDLLTARQNFEKLGTNYSPAENITISHEAIANVNCYWFSNKNNKPGNKLIIYLHGGCFVLGSINSHKALVSHLANELHLPVCFIEYSLAPEHPFPMAINEIVKVYKKIQDPKKYDEIILIGDSAGAALAMSVISKLNKQKITGPSKLLMISPWIDLRNNNDSLFTNAAIDPVLTKESLEKFTSLYLGKTSLAEANPIETMFGDFPPTLILVGDREILLDDSKLAYYVISKIQPVTNFSIYENVTHVWLLDNIQSKSSKEAIQEISTFIS